MIDTMIHGIALSILVSDIELRLRVWNTEQNKRCVKQINVKIYYAMVLLKSAALLTTKEQ